MIYVTGDCHGNFRRFQSEYFPEQANKTMTRWRDTPWQSGTAARCIAFGLTCCT